MIDTVLPTLNCHTDNIFQEVFFCQDRSPNQKSKIQKFKDLDFS